jgi:phage protein D
MSGQQSSRLNDARRPRGAVRITWGKDASQKVTEEVAGWLEWEVNTNAFYQADTFRVTFAQSALPKAYDIAWWSAQQQLWVEILAGFADAQQGMTSWIYGMVDEVSYDPVNRTIEVSGRDLTSQLIDTRATQKWQNLTSSEIAAQIAAKHGLLTHDATGSTIAVTSTPAGRYGNKDYAHMAREQSDWDVLTWLAQQEGFVVYVRGQCLYFQPKPDPAAAPYMLTWQAEGPGAARANVSSISFARNLTLARDVVVEVKSWTMDDPTKPFVKRATAAHSAGSVGAAQTYSYTIPNLTPVKAAQKAQALLAQITMHEVKVSAALPADNVLDVSSVIQVSGTHSSFDQTYYPEEIVRHMSMEHGYTMTLSAKSASPVNVVSA